MVMDFNTAEILPYEDLHNNTPFNVNVEYRMLNPTHSSGGLYNIVSHSIAEMVIGTF